MHVSAAWSCSDGCKDNDCDEGYGRCLKGCKPNRDGYYCCQSGFYGRLCDEPCPSNCKLCIHSYLCKQCTRGYYGRSCNQCPEHCYQCSSSSKCSVCYVGYFGTTCTEQCPSGCKFNYCEKVTGICRVGCRHNYDGLHCSECKRGYYGEDCTETCSPGCIDGVCLSNGTCTRGCNSDMFSGDNCYIKDDTTDITGESETGSYC